MDDEVVDDSEPERLQKRKERKNKRKARATASTNKKADIIVLTDEEVEVGARDYVSISMTSGELDCFASSLPNVSGTSAAPNFHPSLGQPKTSSQVQNPTDGDESDSR
jgi:hypothetical protein